MELPQLEKMVEEYNNFDWGFQLNEVIV